MGRRWESRSFLRARLRLLRFILCWRRFLRYGVPAEWLEDVRKANEDTLLELADHLPSEAAEALLDLATGAKPQAREVRFAFARQLQGTGAREPVAATSPFEHPDAQRRFRVITNVEELERALDYPWDKWMIFLHPAQRQLVERDFGGPARVSGSAGTGKTIVALHRAVFLARSNPAARVLLTTFSDPLANALRAQLRRLISNEPRLAERLEVLSMNAIARRLYERNIGRVQIAGGNVINELIAASAASIPESKFSQHFLRAEWEQVVDAWHLESWEAYRDVTRLGRKTRLKEPQRAILWGIFEEVRAGLKGRGLLTYSDVFTRLAAKLINSRNPPFDYAVVDEAQDVSVAQLRFLASLGSSRRNGLFFTGDLGQRIFQQPFSCKALGIDVRGRSATLRINYRTSHQIRSQADRLLGPVLSDVDGNSQKRVGTISTFNGPPTEDRRWSFSGEFGRFGGWNGAVFHDIDGPVGGVPDSYIVIDDGIADDPQHCQIKQDWNAAVCKGDFGASELTPPVADLAAGADLAVEEARRSWWIRRSRRSCRG